LESSSQLLGTAPAFSNAGKRMEIMNDDLNRLIHTNAQIAFDVGVRTERQRIVNLVEGWLADDQGDLRNVLNLIKTDNENTEKGQK
jgi:hypothetical protein